VAVNTRVLIGSLAAASVISIAGGYALSRSDNAPPAAEDDVTITSNGVFVEPGLQPNDAVEGERLPVIDLDDGHGNAVSTADLIGQPLVINVWATTCQPCKRELPAFAAVHQEFGDRVRFVGINSGADSIEQATAFAAKYGVNYESLKDPNGDFIADLGVFALPYTLFVSSDGRIVVQKGVELTQETIRSTIVDALLS
jgi:peroxiredoxin